MNVFGLALAFLRRRWGQALSALVAGALSIAMVQLVLMAERELPKAAAQAFGGVDLVLGPKGSSLDLVMCCALHVAEPRGLVPLDRAMSVLSSPLIKAKAPIALGEGAGWTAPSQAVLGAQAARDLGLKMGDHFIGSHGLAPGGEEHDEFPYEVVGILAATGSGLDRLILTSIDTVWVIHQHHEADEAKEHNLPPPIVAPPAATAILVAVKSPMALASLPRQIDASEQFSAAVPVFETARLVRAVRPVVQALTGVGVLFALVAALTATAVLAASMAARVRDLALLRVLGAHPWELASIALIESLILALAALIMGEALVWALAGPVVQGLAEREGLVMAVQPSWHNVVVLGGGSVVAGLVAALFPAWRALRAPIEKVLSP